MTARVFVTPTWQAFMRSSPLVKKQVVHHVAKDLQALKQIMRVEKFAITVGLLHDQDMQVLNQLFRKKFGATDILSFPYHTDIKAGWLPQPDEAGDFQLGEILLGFPYLHSPRSTVAGVTATARADASDSEKAHPSWQSHAPVEPVRIACREMERGRGTGNSRQSQPPVDPIELRRTIVVLLAHGMCHLMGYDHQRNDDFQRMHAREKEVLEEYSHMHEEATILKPFTEAPADD